MSDRNTHRRNRDLRGLALALTLLCVGGQVSSAIHVSLVRHVSCPEHGELVHSGAGEAPATPARGGPGFDASGASLGHGHEHCKAVAQRPAGIDVNRPEATAASFAPERVAVATPVSRSHPQPVPLLRLAPKSSPPA